MSSTPESAVQAHTAEPPEGTIEDAIRDGVDNAITAMELSGHLSFGPTVFGVPGGPHHSARSETIEDAVANVLDLIADRGHAVVPSPLRDAVIEAAKAWHESWPYEPNPDEVTPSGNPTSGTDQSLFHAVAALRASEGGES